jgi:hypothetical protein
MYLSTNVVPSIAINLYGLNSFLFDVADENDRRKHSQYEMEKVHLRL